MSTTLPRNQEFFVEEEEVRGMGTTGKSVRDAGLVGGTTAIALSLLTHYGIEAALAVPLSTAVGGFAAWAYRSLRNRWPWLADLDPTGAGE